MTRPVQPFLSARLAILALSLSGCTLAAKIEVSELPKPLVEPIPARVGIYYPPELIDHEKIIAVNPADEGTVETAFRLGPPSTAVFDQVFTHSFVETGRVDSRPPFSNGTRDFDAIIEVTANHFHVRYVPPVQASSLSAEYTASVAYVFTLWALDGSQIANWQSKQASKLDVGFTEAASRLGQLRAHGYYASEATADAIREVAADFLRSFSRQVEVQEWIKTLVIEKKNISDD